MENLDLGAGAPPRAPQEGLPQNFYNLLQREVVLCWTRDKLSNPNAGEAEADENFLSWVTDGYAAAYRAVYAKKEAADQLKATDLKDEAVLKTWLTDLNNEITHGHSSHA